MVNKILKKNIKNIAINLEQTGKKKVRSRKALSKKTQATYNMPKKEYESTWEDEDKFFKGKMKNTKQEMFFK